MKTKVGERIWHDGREWTVTRRNEGKHYGVMLGIKADDGAEATVPEHQTMCQERYQVLTILDAIGSPNYRYVRGGDLRRALDHYLPGWTLEEDWFNEKNRARHPLGHLKHLRPIKTIWILKDEDGKRQVFGQSPKGMLLAIYQIGGQGND